MEPTAELLNAGRGLHPSKSIEWVDDSLPYLACLQDRQESYDVVMLTAVDALG
jgi:hypothetical protein